jgi:hypothetical protein
LLINVFAINRDSLSVDRQSSIEGFATKKICCIVCSTISAICKKESFPDKKASTAISLALLIQQGILPPRSMASYAMDKHRKVLVSGGKNVNEE